MPLTQRAREDLFDAGSSVPRRVQRRRERGWRMPPNSVYVGRGSRWGNPFVIGRDGDRAEVVHKYRRWLWRAIQADPGMADADAFQAGIGAEAVEDTTVTGIATSPDPGFRRVRRLPRRWRVCHPT